MSKINEINDVKCKQGILRKEPDEIADTGCAYYYTCPNSIPCPIHDKNYQRLKKNTELDIFDSRQLDIEVAKALGMIVYQKENVYPHGQSMWYMYKDRPGYRLDKIIIPNYSTDFTKAMESLKEYCGKTCHYQIYHQAGKDYHVKIVHFDNTITTGRASFLSEAICRAIVKDAKRKTKVKWS